jgi:hypothetical protein
MHLVEFLQPRITMHGTTNIKFWYTKPSYRIYYFNATHSTTLITVLETIWFTFRKRMT